ncbi:hypothetical protein BH23BAC2_BH23BAC2_08970 [soil metagenome]
MNLQNRLLLLGFTAIAVGGFVYSQIFIHEKNRRDLREIAQEIANTWKTRLDLTAEQTHVLENIIIEYTIKKNEIINSEISENIKIQKLQKVQKREHKNLKKILDDTKFDTYTNKNIQDPNRIINSLSGI